MLLRKHASSTEQQLLQKNPMLARKKWKPCDGTLFGLLPRAREDAMLMITAQCDFVKVLDKPSRGSHESLTKINQHQPTDEARTVPLHPFIGVSEN